MKKRPYAVFDLLCGGNSPFKGEPLCVSLVDPKSIKAETIPVERAILLFSDRKKALQALHKMFGGNEDWVESRFLILQAPYYYTLEMTLDHLVGMTDCSKFFDGERLLTQTDVINNF